VGVKKSGWVVNINNLRIMGAELEVEGSEKSTSNQLRVALSSEAAFQSLVISLMG